MPFAPRPDPSLMTGDLDTTETAGVTARYGHIQQVSGVFAQADAVDRARAAFEGLAGQQPEQRDQGIGMIPRAGRIAYNEERARWEALAAAQSAQARLQAQGYSMDPVTGQVVRTAPPAPPGGGMGQMLDVEEGRA